MVEIIGVHMRELITTFHLELVTIEAHHDSIFIFIDIVLYQYEFKNLT